jgi:putative lipoic acid-binding regulatory protein
VKQDPDFSNPNPEIAYPTAWTYTVIGADEARLRAAVAEILGGRAHELSPSHTSSGGRWVSMNLKLVVDSHEMRRALYDALAAHGDIRYAM